MKQSQICLTVVVLCISLQGVLTATARLDSLSQEQQNQFKMYQQQQGKEYFSLAQTADGELKDGENFGSGKGFWGWLGDIFDFSESDGESSSSSLFDGELFSLAKTQTLIKSKVDGEQNQDGETSNEGFFDWLFDIFDGESGSSESDGEALGNPLDMIPNPFSSNDGEKAFLIQKKQKQFKNTIISQIQMKPKSQNKGNDGEKSSDSSSDGEGGFMDWFFDIFDGEMSIPNPFDGEFSNPIPNPLDGELLGLSQVSRTLPDCDCKDPVSAKFGKQAWSKDFAGTWGFNKKGNVYGVSDNKEFLPLVEFDKKGNGKLLFKNDCGLKLSDFFDAKSEETYFITHQPKGKNGQNNGQKNQQKGKDGERTDGEQRDGENGVGRLFDWLNFDGESVLGLNLDFFDWDGEFNFFDGIVDGEWLNINGDWNFLPDFDGESGSSNSDDGEFNFFDGIVDGEWLNINGDWNFLPDFDGESGSSNSDDGEYF